MPPAARTINSTDGKPTAIAPALLAWYDLHHRDLPWRTPPAELRRGRRPDPYHVWLSEIMLQQTGVETVKPYFLKFIGKWPDISALAAASTEDVMKAWAGLGYYSRARNLKKCADEVAERMGGVFPSTEAGLKALPGIGDYTAAAIGAIAFDLRTAVVDGNIERVAARLQAIERPVREAKREIRAIVDAMTPAGRPGDFAQAMMDLGATICTPRRPACFLCPLRENCTALTSGEPERFPIPAIRAEKPRRVGAAFVAVRQDGAILLRRRPESGLLGGMTEVPTTDWTARRNGATGSDAAPFSAGWKHAGAITHVFTHFALELQVYRAERQSLAAPADHWWSATGEVRDEALPTIMKKVIEAAVPGATKRPHPLQARKA
ncbi:MAG: A/G-specific adenine glycosylase [Hyphomicrobiales bacterium]|nr:A/G-specific adenine glycosylase [Hyphomicrobiales bacterium]